MSGLVYYCDACFEAGSYATYTIGDLLGGACDRCGGVSKEERHAVIASVECKACSRRFEARKTDGTIHPREHNLASPLSRTVCHGSYLPAELP